MPRMEFLRVPEKGDSEETENLKKETTEVEIKKVFENF
jgi:hypothetical protein